MMTMGNTFSPTSTMPSPPPATSVHSVPASTETTPISAHVIAK